MIVEIQFLTNCALTSTTTTITRTLILIHTHSGDLEKLCLVEACASSIFLSLHFCVVLHSHFLLRVSGFVLQD
jgi:hypothetical protein